MAPCYNAAMPGPGQADLVQALKRRDPEALSSIVHGHAAELHLAARGLGRSEAEAEELVQEVFVAFLDALDRFEGRSTVRTYLFGILYRKALEAGRRRSRELATDPGDAVFDGRFDALGHWSKPPEGPDRDADLAEMARLIGECLDGLPDQQRAAFQLVEVDMEGRDAARNVLGVEDTHLRVLLFRARAKLRECLGSKWGEGALR